MGNTVCCKTCLLLQQENEGKIQIFHQSAKTGLSVRCATTVSCTRLQISSIQCDLPRRQKWYQMPFKHLARPYAKNNVSVRESPNLSGIINIIQQHMHGKFRGGKRNNTGYRYFGVQTSARQRVISEDS